MMTKNFYNPAAIVPFPKDFAHRCVTPQRPFEILRLEMPPHIVEEMANYRRFHDAMMDTLCWCASITHTYMPEELFNHFYFGDFT